MTNPAVSQLPYNRTMSDSADDMLPSFYGPQASENTPNDHRVIKSSGGEAHGSDAGRQTVAGQSVVMCCILCSKEWRREKDGFTCPSCGSASSRVKIIEI